jgi:hypothetical protein
MIDLNHDMFTAVDPDRYRRAGGRNAGGLRGVRRTLGGIAMSMARSATVDIGTTMRLVAPDFATVSVRASLRYDPDDPYAVCVMFHPDGSDADQVAWSFSRELLAKGLEEPTGIGDVRVWPWTTPRGEAIALALSSPDGNALFEINRAVVQRFLRRAYGLVPRGRESAHVDLDSTLTKLLAGGV